MRGKDKNDMTTIKEDNQLYPIAVLIDELRNEDVQVSALNFNFSKYGLCVTASIKFNKEVVHDSVGTGR